MNKKLMALAVLGALGAPELAFAQASTVQIYGTVRESYWSINQGTSGAAGATTGRTTRDLVAGTGGSNIGFRGTESLGGGLNAWFQIESTFPGDEGNSNNQTAGRPWGDRNSAVGLNGGWGSVLFGNWDTPLAWSRTAGYTNDNTGLNGINAIMGNGAPTSCANSAPAAIAGSGGAATISTGCQFGFYRRQQNVVQYWSPNVSGFEARVGFSASEERTFNNSATNISGVVAATTAATGTNAGVPIVSPGGTLTPRLWSIGGRYSNGPLLLNAGYEKHQDYSYNGSSDTGWDIGAGYNIGGSFLITALYERLSYQIVQATGSTTTTTANGNVDRNSWALMADWNIAGPHSLLFGYVKANSTGGSATGTLGGGSTATAIIANGGAGNTGAQMYYLRYKYAFSKRTYVHADYGQLNNDAAATYGLHITGNVIPQAGGRQSGYGVGITHTF